MIEELRKKILSIYNKKSLELQGIPEYEIKNYLNYKIFPVELLIKADWNYKEEDEFTSNKLQNNLKRVGQTENIHVRELETGYFEVINGNHRLDEIHNLGRKFVVVYDHGIISLAEAKRRAIETNETKFVANEEKLQQILTELNTTFDDFHETMPFKLEELTINSENQENEADPISVNEDNYEHQEIISPKTLPGDLYEFGGHRLLCGDSTSAIDVSKLMNGKIAHMLHTDPPYNVKYAEINMTRSEGAIDWSDKYCTEWNDDMSTSDYKKFLYNFLKNAKGNMIDTAHYYIWHASTFFREIFDTLDELNIPYDKVPIQWVKQNAPLSWCRYKRKTEPCIYAGKGAVNGAGKDARWFGPNNETNVWAIDKDPTQNYIHPTQKPVAIPVRAITNSSQPGEIVLEFFGGSGSTIIAADQLKRYCYAMELSPSFCDGIMKRYITLCKTSNKQPEILLNGNIIPQNYFDNE